MLYEPTKEKIEDRTLAINIQDEKIRCISGAAIAYLDIEEDIEKFSYQSLAENLKIDFGDEIYLFHGMKSDNGFRNSDLGLLSDEDKNYYLNEHNLNVFIKLVCE